MLDPILQLLVQNGYLDEDSAKEIQDVSKTEGKPVRRLVIDQEILSEDDLLSLMAADQNTEAIDLANMTLEKFPHRVYAASNCLPVEQTKGGRRQAES